MGNVKNIQCMGGSRGQYRGSGSNGQTAEGILKNLLVTNYDKVAADFQNLSPEQKKQFCSLFSTLSEQEFLLGAERMEMEIDLIDDDQEAGEILNSLN